MYLYMLTSARETGSCQVSSFLHDADNISGCFECDSSSNMCLGCSKEPSHRNGETVLLSTQDKCLLLRNQVICHLFLSGGLVTFFRVLSPRKYCNEDSGPSKLIV